MKFIYRVLVFLVVIAITIAGEDYLSIGFNRPKLVGEDVVSAICMVLLPLLSVFVLHRFISTWRPRNADVESESSQEGN